MNQQQILALYEWQAGTCFRHPCKGDVPTAVVQTVHQRVGDDEPVRACEECVIEPEQERWVAASESGLEYRPGHADEPLQ
ncbi:class-II aminoacyl-tRNA synthetase family protein [Streptomyces triticiradicis]|uniref:Uncharacterized protein n=1 Tax=Streptomyces triticiradicis TaxID=2651189 RepID=A0A7J5D5B2_9ACTN|nr:hypothetical protein [Streptomyces triticiradicis]KAB1979447.1 hypothetical protein F8144_36140 [Streptomyces triticiradicis]